MAYQPHQHQQPHQQPRQPMGIVLLSPSFNSMEQGKARQYSSEFSANKHQATMDEDTSMALSGQFDMPMDMVMGPMDDGDAADGEQLPYMNRESFYNYAAFDSLRPGPVVQSLFQREYFGLAICAMGYGFANIWISYPFKQMLMEFQFLHFPKLWSPTLLIMQWPDVFALVCGMLSDCYPMFGYRRKSYIIVGWLTVFFAALAMVVIYCIGDQKSKATMVWTYVVTVVMWLGMELAWVTTLAISIEYAQRERLHQRGKVQSAMFMFRYGTESLAVLIAATFLWPDAAAKHYTSAISLGVICLILAIVSLVPIPFVVYCMEEQPVPPNSHVHITKRLAEVWRLMSQRAVYTIVLAMGAMFIFISANYSPVNSAVRVWGGFLQKNAIWLYLSVYPVRFVSVFIWNRFMINSNWRWFMGCGLLLGVGFRALCGCIISADILRSKGLFIITQATPQIPLGWTSMLQLIPTTEIVHLGREGTTIGLINTCGQVVSIACSAFWTFFQKKVNIQLTLADIAKDTIKTRHTAIYTLLAINAYAALSAVVVFFLPSQKLDAQQLRAFGGYHQFPRYVIAFLLAGLFIFDLANNLVRSLNQ